MTASSSPTRSGIFTTVALTLALSCRLGAADPLTIAQGPAVTTQAGGRVAIYIFPPPGFDPNRAGGYWPYPYPPYPYPHPGFPSYQPYPLYGGPAYGGPAPYVPLGSPFPPPPVEVRSMELKPGGRLVIEVEPVDAAVYVDAMQLTTRSDLGYEIGLLAGRHRVDVRHSGARPWSEDVDVPPGGGLLIKVQLEASGDK